jgi:AraC-like DNA-binding protein
MILRNATKNETRGGDDMGEMQRVWSTGDAPPGKTLSYWIEAICEAFLEMKAASPRPAEFAARLVQRPFGPIDLNFADATVQEVWRTRQAVARSHKQNFYLLFMREGSLRIRQRGREAVIASGDCALVDSREPYSFSFPETHRCLSLQIPQNWLRLWLPSSEDAVAIPLSVYSPWGRTLASAISNLAKADLDTLALPNGVIADQLGAMLALAAGCGAPCTTHRQAMLRRIHETLRERLYDPSLDPETVATAYGISKRYLHLLFADAGTSFSATLIALRLEKAKSLLDDPRFARTGIAEIAWRCGFVEPSHFARRFRARYGEAPAAYRKTLHS